MQKQIGLLLILAVLMSAVAAQERVRDKSESGPHRADMAQRKVEEAQRRLQAVDILKGVVESAADIQESRTRVTVLTGALDLLWKHDEAYTRANFLKSANALLDRYTSDATDRPERSEIRASMEILLKKFARHDPQAAERLLDRFQKRLEDEMNGHSVSPGERLSLAEAGLDSDVARSVALAAKVLETDVPGSFPSYLNELEQRDSAAAATLFRTALSILASGRIYNPAQATVLSAYAFRESQVSVPTAIGGRDGVPLEFGMFASRLTPPSRNLNRALAAAYLAAAGSYLNTEVIGLERLANPDAIHVGLCYFLVKKLRGYADRLGMDRGQNWVMLDTKFVLLADRAKLSGSALSGLTTVAQRIVTENNVFRFDGGEAALAAAENAGDPTKRTELLATGIRQQIDEGKYAEATQRIADVREERFREQLNIYLSFRVAEASLKKLDWDGFNAQLNRVSDAQLRAYLILSASLAANDATNKEMFSGFLVAAMSVFPKIEDTEARAAALVTTAGILFAAADSSWGAHVLTDGVKAINRAERYAGGAYTVTLEAPLYKMLLPIPRFDLSHCFEQAAKRDWSASIAAAQGIESKVLRSQAYIAACRNIL